MTTQQTLFSLVLAGASVAFATAAQAECLTDAQAAELVANYMAKTPAANPENLSDADGLARAARSTSCSPSAWARSWATRRA